MAVQEYVQQIAEAISTVLKIDVEIADRQLVRVAGTGRYRDRLGKSMEQQGFIYREVLRTGRQMVIDNPGQNILCAPCPAREGCCERYEVISPIQLTGKTVGAIGLICFSEEQAKLIAESPDSYLVFLAKMAETIGLKLKEQEFTDSLLRANHYLASIINCIDEGLVNADLSGQVLQCNQAAHKLLPGLSVKPGTTLGGLFGAGLATEILEAGKRGENGIELSARIATEQGIQQLMLRISPGVTEDGVQSIVIVLRPFEEISRMVNRVSTQEAGYTVDDILGDSQAMRQLREQAAIVAGGKSTVLIRGESGTGKGMLARAIHSLSPRHQGPFVAINCSAIPEALLESELFGYEEGAFTGARKGGKIGKFELANQGTLFLDEIGDMPLYLQVKILRVLQERQIERVGGLAPIPVDVRLLAATHRDIEQMMRQGEFREDLYYRINVIPMFITPLRERKEDLDTLVLHFVRLYNQQLGKQVQGMSEQFRLKVWRYSWPGNVRELQNAIEYAMNLCLGTELEEEHLPSRVKQTDHLQDNGLYKLDIMEKEMIGRCLQRYGFTVQGKVKAASALGIGIATLYRKMARYGIMEACQNDQAAYQNDK